MTDDNLNAIAHSIFGDDLRNLYDEDGRLIAGPQPSKGDGYVRPMGPWDTNESTIVTICGWCPDARDRTVQLKSEGKTVSHGMCDACQKKFEEQA